MYPLPVIKKSRCVSGFTLIELAISLTIIALLISLISVGMSIYHQAVLHRFIAQFTDNKASILAFQDKYGYFPGDFSSAFTLWPTCGGGIPSRCNGNGDGIVTMYGEDYEFWEHMSLANMSSGQYVYATSWYASGKAIAVSVPQTPLSVLSGYWALDSYPCLGDLLTMIAGTYRSDGFNALDDGSMTPMDSYAVDMKIDDGNPLTGRYYIMRSQSSASNTSLCSNYTSTCATNATYLFTDYTASCVPLITVYR